MVALWYESREPTLEQKKALVARTGVSLDQIRFWVRLLFTPLHTLTPNERIRIVSTRSRPRWTGAEGSGHLCRRTSRCSSSRFATGTRFAGSRTTSCSRSHHDNRCSYCTVDLACSNPCASDSEHCPAGARDRPASRSASATTAVIDRSKPVAINRLPASAQRPLLRVLAGEEERSVVELTPWSFVNAGRTELVERSTHKWRKSMM